MENVEGAMNVKNALCHEETKDFSDVEKFGRATKFPEAYYEVRINLQSILSMTSLLINLFFAMMLSFDYAQFLSKECVSSRKLQNSLSLHSEARQDGEVNVLFCD